jgi:N-carbamoyl-L-amino-acid hydrolase
MLTLERINAASATEFATLVAGAYERAPWIAVGAEAARPFRSVAHLKRALVEVVRAADATEQRTLLQSARSLAEAFTQGTRGPPNAAALEEFTRLDASYRERFGFPFILAPAGPGARGLALDEALATLRRRVKSHPAFEHGEGLRQLHRQAELWLENAFGESVSAGNLIWDWAEALALHRDAGPGEPLTVTYLTAAHQACSAQLQQWMRECGFDEVGRDQVGNVVASYRGSDPAAPRLLTGSHFDTVRNAGRYDGRLGIFVPMACVRALSSAGRRLPFGIELVGFAEEEGQRYATGFLGSSALTGKFDPRWLAQQDQAGVTMGDAMRAAGLSADAAAIAAIRRDANQYLGFVEVHIEQGPVLTMLDLPLGVVTSINGSVRFLGEFTGMASHAGTTPMGQRRDAATGAAALALYLEKRASSGTDLVGTVGILEVPEGSINVIPGRCRFSLDIRATEDGQRDACVHDVEREIAAICASRQLQVSLRETTRSPASPCAPEWRERWERAVASLGLPVHRMPSGAGHDAMEIHHIMPQAMLFVRGLNSGISHNPLEAITNHDAELAVRAFTHLLEELATGQGGRA